jgi:bacillithiol system protein YtxJ
MTPWIILSDAAQIDELVQRSYQTPCLIFKHSTRCSISRAAQNRLEQKWNFAADELSPYYLDLLQYRPLSNQIAEQFGVRHESPQVLLIINGKCVYDNSHNAISVADLAAALDINPVEA